MKGGVMGRMGRAGVCCRSGSAEEQVDCSRKSRTALQSSAVHNEREKKKKGEGGEEERNKEKRREERERGEGRMMRSDEAR